jgi:hypothetical protein
MFLLLGFYVDNADYFYWVIIMALSSRAELYVLKHLFPSYPYLSRFFGYLLKILFAVSLAMCVDCILTSIILPIFHKFILSLKEKYSGILKMAGGNPKITNTGGAGNNDPTPNPKPKDNYTGYPKDDEKKKRNLEEYYTYEQNYDNFLGKIESMQNYKEYNNRTFNMPRILENYREYLSSEDKSKLNDLLNKKSHKIPWSEKTTVKEY